MTQDVLAPRSGPTGGAHLHDPQGQIVEIAAAADPGPCPDLGFGVASREETIQRVNAEAARRGHPPVLPPVISEVERAARLEEIAAELATEDASAAVPQPEPTAVQPPAEVPAVQPPHDPDATVVIGRHRSDGTRDFRPLPEPDDEPPLPDLTEPPRRKFIGRVTAAVVARFRRRSGQ